MSKKPLKVNEQKALQKRLKEKTARKSRGTGAIPELPPYTMIFCEGAKTEPLYLGEIVKLIKARYSAYAAQNRIKMDDLFCIEGVGQSNKTLLKYAKTKAGKHIQCVWVVYDKDDFPKKHFNEAPRLADQLSKEGYTQFYTAWSNECIELWFLLHFQELEANISRDCYKDKLKSHYPSYTKTSEDIFITLQCHTGDAIKRAKNQHQSFLAGTEPSDMSPCTTVYQLVEFLLKYI